MTSMLKIDDFICFGLCFAATEGGKAAGTH
jgi:hypothetical protein